MSEYAIRRVGVRAELVARNEPYWGPPLEVNCHLGFRKIDAERGSWIARVKKDGQRSYKALGSDSATFSFKQAKEKAEKWFADLEQGLVGEDVTVKSALELYVKHLRDQKKKPLAAHDAECSFKRSIYETPLAKVLLANLRKHHFQSWLDSLKLNPSTLKRAITPVRAALNLAVRKDRVSAALKQTWTGVELPEIPDGRRTLFLDLAQRRALLAAASGPVRDLIEGVMVTGARAGELVNATCGQFDARHGMMVFKGKTGPRTVPLMPAALALFKRLAKDKLPLAYLFTRNGGQKWQHSGWDELVRDAADKAGLPKGTCLYVLRHSWITEAIAGGLSILEVARMTGTSVMMIEKHYGHFQPAVALERLSKVTMT